VTNKIFNIVFFVSLIFLALIDWQWSASPFIYLILLLVYFSVNFWGAAFISSQFFLPATCKSDKETKSIAITFDDGPVPLKTLQILDILKKHQAKATFFCIGENVKEYPEIVRQIHDEGHLIGNHSYFHGATFDLLSVKNVVKELNATNNAIREAIGLVPRLFRPPYGVTNPMLAKAVSQLRFTAIGWSVRSLDTIIKEKGKLYERVTKKMQGGDVILFHDRCEVTIEILDDVLNYIKSKGIKIESLDKLLDEKAYEG
jgi:peptidoglycan-N-acetylglucosamine deacetylase